MKKPLVAVAVVVAGLAVGGCGTLTVGGTPILGFESDKDKEGRPVPAFGTVITVYQYGATTQPAPTPPGAPPPSPTLQQQGVVVMPPSVAYATVYPPKWDDPRLVVFMNQSLRPMRVRVDNGEEIRLLAYQSTADLKVGVGEHRVRVVVERGNPPDIIEVERLISVTIRPDGRSQVVQLYDW